MVIVLRFECKMATSHQLALFQLIQVDTLQSRNNSMLLAFHQVICEQRWGINTCTTLLVDYHCSSNFIKSVCCDFYCPASTTTTMTNPATTTVTVIPGMCVVCIECQCLRS